MHTYCKTLSLALALWVPGVWAADGGDERLRLALQALGATFSKDPLVLVRSMLGQIKTQQEAQQYKELRGQAVPQVYGAIQRAYEIAESMQQSRLSERVRAIAVPPAVDEIVEKFFPEAQRQDWQVGAAAALRDENPLNQYVLVSATGRRAGSNNDVRVVIQTFAFNPLRLLLLNRALSYAGNGVDATFTHAGDPAEIVASAAWQQKLVRPLRAHYENPRVALLLPNNLEPLFQAFADSTGAASFLREVCEKPDVVVARNVVVSLGQKLRSARAAAAEADSVADKLRERDRQ